MATVRAGSLIAWAMVVFWAFATRSAVGQCDSSTVRLRGICTDSGGGGVVVVRVRAKDLAGNVIEEAWTDFDGIFKIRMCRNHVVGDSVVLEAAFPTYATGSLRLPARSHEGLRFSMIRADTVTVLGLDSVKNFRSAEHSFRGCGTSVDPDPLYIHCNGTIKRYEELKQEADLDWEEWRRFVP